MLSRTMRKTHQLVTIVSIATLVACSTSNAPKSSATVAVAPPVAPEPPAAVVELYAELEAAARDYESGLELLTGGELTEGGSRIDAARARIRAGADRCVGTAGCDVARFVGVLDDLFAEQGRVLSAQLAATATAPTNPVEAGGEVDWTEEEIGSEQAADLTEVVPEVSRTAALLRGSDLRERIQLNPMILGEIQDWLTWRRPMLIEAWRNFHYLRAEIAPIYEDAGLPEALLFAMIATESGGKVHVTSRAGAAGLLQFMRYTGARFGLKTVDGFDQRYDPVAATRAAVGYLNEQFGVLNDDLEKALAAYNGGEGRMRGLHSRNPGASFWDSRIYSQLPRETRDYVPRILAAAWLFLHPEEYSLAWPADDSGLVATVDLPRAASLSDLAICIGSAGGVDDGWFRVLRNLNPRHEATARLPEGTSLRIPEPLVDELQRRCVDDPAMVARIDEIAAAAAKVRAATPRSTGSREWKTYRVAQGDTLSRIAARNRCTSVRELGQLNNLRAPRYAIRVGQRLRVPVC